MRPGSPLCLLIAAFVATACGVTETLTDRDRSQVPQDKLDRTPPRVPPPSFSLDGMPYVLRFEQGYEREYDVRQYARVDRGNPVVTVRNLPAAATFDGRVLRWRPSCGKDPTFYKAGLGVHTVIFALRSDDGSDHFIERDAGLVVNEFRDFGGQRACEEIVE